MRFQSVDTRVPSRRVNAPTRKRRPSSSQSAFRQRPLFSNPLDEESYEGLPEESMESPVQLPDVVPVDYGRNRTDDPDRILSIVRTEVAGSGDGDGVSDHGLLTGLGDDDHSQYHNDTRGDARYYTESELNAGQLDSRYYTESELNAGQLDSRYYTEAEITSLLSGKSDTGHTHEGTAILSAGPVTDGYVLTATGAGGAAWEEAPAGAEEIDDLTDVDTTTDPPAKNECLKWNGSEWVPAPYDYNFTFSIASFSDGEATTQLIGAGVWKADETMTFAATYNNGPPTSSVVEMSINGAAYAQVGTMVAPGYTAGTNDDGDINYPALRDQYLRFRLSAGDGVDSDIEYETSIYFRNYRFWGVISAAQKASITEADVEALSSELSNSTTFSKSINSGSNQYLCVAYPANYSPLEASVDYETGGNCDFLFNSITVAMQLLTSSLSITNSAGYTEDYRVYASLVDQLGNHSLYAATTVSCINPLYYGKTSKTSGYTEADIEALANSEVTNDNTQVWDAVTTGSGEYMLFAFPKRLGTVTFWVGGFEGGFLDPETVVNVSNANSWTEDYYVWRSENDNLGETVVETK